MRAAEFRKQWSHKPTPIPSDATGLWYSEECTEQLMAEFAASERQAVIEDCCRAVCYGCKHGVPFTESGENHASGTGAIYECKAAAIRSME